MVNCLRSRRRDLLVLVLILVLKAAEVEAQTAITLQWDPNPEPNVGGYLIGYGTRSGIDEHLVDVGFATRWTLSGLSATTVYYFRVYAYSLSGVRSAPSAEVSNAPGTAPPSSGCATPDPFASLGGGTCHNGAWLPPGMAPPGAAPAPAPPPPRAPTIACTTPDPFVALGGGTCYNGGWLPPGMPIPQGSLTSSSTTIAAATFTETGGCTTPDPFVELQGLIGICQSGGWIPVPGVSTTGTINFYNYAEGFWGIAGDDGRIYRPLAAVPSGQRQNGLRVIFKGTLEGEISAPVPIHLIRLLVLVSQ